jgi:hypothetical protein
LADSTSADIGTKRRESGVVYSCCPRHAPRAALCADTQGPKRCVEFFTTQISNDHTRKAYLNAMRRFSSVNRFADNDRLR